MASGTWHNVTLAGKAILNVDAPRRAGIFITDTLTLDDGEVLVGDRFGIYGQGAFSINGTGTIVLDAGWMEHYPSSGEVTIGKDVIIRTGPTGGGAIAGSSDLLVNHGAISAETPGQTLTIFRPVINYGTLQNKNHSDLVIGTDSWTNDGTILAIGPYRAQGFVIINASHFENAETGLIGGTGRLVIPHTTLVNHGTIAPGLSVGTLTIAGDVQLTDSSLLDLEIGGGGFADRLIVQGNVELGGILQLSALSDFSLSDLNPITVLTTSGGIIQGQFDNAGPVRLRGHDFHIHYGITSVWLTPVRVPEPGSWGVLLAAVAGAGAVMRRRR